MSVYERDPLSGAWTRIAVLPIAYGQSPPREGEIALQGSLLVGGNPRSGGPGEVKVFLRHLGEPVFGLAQGFSAEDGTPGDGFGSAVTLAESTLAVGAPFGSVGTGVVYVYEFPRPGEQMSLAPRLRRR